VNAIVRLVAQELALPLTARATPEVTMRCVTARQEGSRWRLTQPREQMVGNPLAGGGAAT
jgi:hypothetical protein